MRHAIANALTAKKDRPYRMRERKVRPDGSAYNIETRFERLRGGDPKAPARVVVTQRQIV